MYYPEDERQNSTRTTFLADARIFEGYIPEISSVGYGMKVVYRDATENENGGTLKMLPLLMPIFSKDIYEGLV